MFVAHVLPASLKHATVPSSCGEWLVRPAFKCESDVTTPQERVCCRQARRFNSISPSHCPSPTAPPADLNILLARHTVGRKALSYWLAFSSAARLLPSPVPNGTARKTSWEDYLSVSTFPPLVLANLTSPEGDITLWPCCSPLAVSP